MSGKGIKMVEGVIKCLDIEKRLENLIKESKEDSSICVETEYGNMRKEMNSLLYAIEDIGGDNPIAVLREGLFEWMNRPLERVLEEARNRRKQ